MIKIPPAERRAIILSYDLLIASIVNNLRSRLEVIKRATSPKKIVLLQTFQFLEKRQLSGILNERLALCEQMSRSK